MRWKVTVNLLLFLLLVFLLSGVFRTETAVAEGGSKLTIAYMADEIGRIEPCG
jgi:hypothetical protein